MIALTAQTRIWIAREPADFRCGIDGLAKICRTVLKSDPFSGALFVFRNRRSKSIKILSYNSRGFWLRSEEHTSELQSHSDLVCRLLLEKKNETRQIQPCQKQLRPHR